MQAYPQNVTDQVAAVTVAPTKPSPKASAIAAYRKEEHTNLTPVQVVYKLYDIGVLACKRGDKLLARKAINELIVGLNFEYEEIAVGLYRLYDYAKRCIREDNMPEAVKVLEELRSAWGTAFKLQGSSNE